MLSRLLFWKRPVDPFIEHQGIFFPVSILQVLLVQSASAEVRRRFKSEGNVDLIFSRKSWGFHYPLTEYLAEVARSLSKHGVVIPDVRAGQGKALFHEYFHHFGVLEQGSKSSLMIASAVRRLV
jgi:hypothetical protein